MLFTIYGRSESGLQTVIVGGWTDLFSAFLFERVGVDVEPFP